MVDTIEISKDDENIFYFESFELCLSKSENYILSNKGMFLFTSLSDFILDKTNHTYVIAYEDMTENICLKDYIQIDKLWKNYN